MKKFLFVHQIIFILFLGAVSSFSQETAIDLSKKHFDRGVAIIENAESPEDYKLAIKEFEEAVRLAPDWPEAYYNLGMVQEVVGKFTEAILSFRSYLLLAPDADDAGAVKSQINKLEYRAETVLTISNIIDVLIEYGDYSKWTKTGEDEVRNWTVFTKEGENSVKILSAMLYYRNPDTYYQTLKVVGNLLKFSFTIDQCDPVNPGACPRIYEAEVEVISKTNVKVKGFFYWTNRDNSQKHYFSSEYIKK